MRLHTDLALQIIDSFPYSIGLYNVKTCTLEYTNEIARRRFGMPDNDLNIQNWLNKISETVIDQNRLLNFWETWLINKPLTTQKIIDRFKLADDNSCKAEIALTAVTDQNNEISHVMISIVEVLGEKDYSTEEEFIYLASHDLLSPARKIATFTERMKDKYSDILASDPYMNRLENNIAVLRNVIDSLTDYSLLALRAPKKEICNLTEIVNKLMVEFMPLLKENNTTISCRELPRVFTDKGQCIILFRQLIDNSIRFRKTDSEQRIDISSEMMTGEEMKDGGKNNFCRIKVSDIGVGFPADKEREIFKPFVRIHGNERGGNGMGLAICNKIADNLGWEIEAESDEGSHTCFSLILPSSNIADV